MLGYQDFSKSGVMIIALFFMLSSCGKSQNCTTLGPNPGPFFVIKRNDSIITDSTLLLKIKLYHLNKWGEKVYDPSEDLSDSVDLDDSSFVYLAQSYFPYNPDYRNTGIMFLRYLDGLSVDSKIYNFYLQFPDGDIDTIFIQAERVSCEQGLKERCRCELPVRILKFNGQLVSEDTAYHLSNDQPVYIFNK